MALNIKDPVTDRLARELAALTGESITLALRRALEQRLEAERRKATRSHRDLTSIIERGRARTILDHRPEAEILGLGDDGLPG